MSNPSDDVSRTWQVAEARDRPARGVRLPRPAAEYFSSPWETWQKLLEWLTARWYLRTCDRVGPWARVTGRPFVRNLGQMILGDRVRLYSHFARSVLVTSRGGRLEVGDRTALNYGLDISATGLVRIGSDCLIGTHVIILDNDYHDTADRDRTPLPRPVIIGNNVWIGNGALILPGVNIGDGAVIGAGSVVMSNVPAHALALGNPARIVKRLDHSSPD